MRQNLLRGKLAWVFGGTSGIGMASARALAQAGATVVVAGRSVNRMKKALEMLPKGVIGETVDANESGSLARTLEKHGPINHLVVSIGGGSAIGPYRTLTEAELRATFDSKYWQIQRITLAALASMHAGSITWITGAAARAAIPGMSSLAATNGALNAMVGPLARELTPVRVNAVSPGFIDTPYWENAMDPSTREKTYSDMASLVPAQRVGTPDDVAQAVMLCVCNSFMTGAIIDCDGGRRLV